MAAATAVMEIPELLALVLSFVGDSADLISMARATKKFTDFALSQVWRNPSFEGDPLLSMAHLFPEVTHNVLVEGRNSEHRLDASMFGRFDYYAKFIRHLRVWQPIPEGFIARILCASRPDVWLFPNLLTLHVGCDGDSLHMIGPYLSPSLQELKINHWEPENSPIVASSSQTSAILLQIFDLPNLEVLDLMDTRYPDYEKNAAVVDALVELIPQLVSFTSSDFTTLKPVYDALARSGKLQSVFIDLYEERNSELHYALESLTRMMCGEFDQLQNLSLLCAGPKAARFLREVDRELCSIDLHIDGDLLVHGLADLVSSVATSIPTLRSFRCVASQAVDEPGVQLLMEALQPLSEMKSLENLHIGMSFSGEQMLNDDDVHLLFPLWPQIQTFTLESDPGTERPVLAEDDPIGFALTLVAIQHIHRYARDLRQLCLAYVDLSTIPEPDIGPAIESLGPVEILFTRSHAHDRKAIRTFLTGLWQKASIDFEPCCMVTMPHTE